MRVGLLTILALVVLAGQGAAISPPGSPERLTDWRWLARPPEGQRTTLFGTNKLEAYEGKFLLLATTNPVVLDHLILRNADLNLSITADDRLLWEGKVGALASPPTNRVPLFPPALVPAGASFYHVVAPIGARQSLRILVDKPDTWRYLSYRTFPDPSAITPATADPNGAYAKGLQVAATAWKEPGGFRPADVDATSRVETAQVKIEAGTRVTALDLSGSGEITHLEFHMIPALIGSMRELVVEFYYDGAKDPALRLPITDLIGLPHPWTGGRWDVASGTLAAGILLPRQDGNGRHPDATFYFNLPVPFANGLRIDLVNRSAQRAFSGSVRAVVVSAPDAPTAGRLCGTRLIAPVTNEIPYLTMSGPGQLVALSLFCTGNDIFPPAQINGAAWLKADAAPAVGGAGLVPLWMGAGYGGPYGGLPVWNHPRLEPGYVGATRVFLTDPMPFDREAAFGYNPGKDLAGAPTSATVIALWYRFGGTPYAAPALPAHAEALPYTTLYKPDWYVPVEGARLASTIEAEDLAAMAVGHGGEARDTEDPDHNYHVSKGHYLVIRTDNIGDYVDCPLPFPSSLYFIIGHANVSMQVDGMVHTCYELSLLSREQARRPPPEVSAADRFAWSVLGGAKMNLQLFMLNGPSYRRDPVNYYAPQLNPARDGDGVFRFICRGPGVRLLGFDHFWLYMPPSTAEGWHEFEEGSLAETSNLTASLPLTGRMEWSGWGAQQLDARDEGKTTLRMMVLTSGPATPKELRLSGSLAPGGTWQAAVAGSTTPAVTLTPGKDASQKVEWTIPVAGLNLPGPLALDITYTPPTNVDKKPISQLYLDAWTAR